MKTQLLTGVLSVLFLVGIAAAGEAKSDYNGLNNPGTQHLYMYEKDPTDWSVVDTGAWGKLTFTDNFVFNGHGLEKATDYTLIRYSDPWPGSPICLASGTTNNGGNIHLAGEMLDGGPKVWLVLSEDVDCDNAEMTGWNPTEYLFEYNLI